MFASTPSTCTRRTLDLPRKDWDIRCLRYLGNSDIACFQYRADALRVQGVLRKRLAKFNLTLEPNKTKLVEFGRFAARHAPKRGRRRPETIYFVGFTPQNETVLHPESWRGIQGGDSD